jgi:hypothetical protein
MFFEEHKHFLDNMGVLFKKRVLRKKNHFHENVAFFGGTQPYSLGNTTIYPRLICHICF